MYRAIKDFAPDIQNDYSADPLYYCTTDYMDSQFLHGAQGRTFGRYNLNCSEFLSARCAMNWDDVCEAMSKDKETRFPDTTASISMYPLQRTDLTYGEQLIRDSAYKKYKIQSYNCNLVCEPFDPTVVNSPVICYESRAATSAENSVDRYSFSSGNIEGAYCQSTYAITPVQALVLDNDPIMNKILNKPQIAMELLEDIYTGMKNTKTLGLLKGTRLGLFYQYLGHSLDV